jgi:2-oxoglutarate ferredoxin oxidoreductase subunit beta
VARSVDVFQSHLKSTLERAAQHQGTAFVEIYQNCNIFNDRAFHYLTEKEARDENALYLEHGKPMVFGKQRPRGIVARDSELEIVDLVAGGPRAEDCLVWNEHRKSPSLAFDLVTRGPDFPVPLGVLRAVEAPAYETGVIEQLHSQEERRGAGSLEALLGGGETWTVS